MTLANTINTKPLKIQNKILEIDLKLIETIILKHITNHTILNGITDKEGNVQI